VKNKMRAVVALLTTVAALGAMTVTASADVGNGRNQPIRGNFTLDKFTDTATLGHDSLGCTLTVKRVYAFGLTSTKVYRYVVPGVSNFNLCPDMGVAVPTGNPLIVDDIVVTWFNRPPGPAAAAYVLRNFTTVIAATGENFPSYIGSGVDFNGDGLQDFWERTDEGEGFRTYLRSGSTFVAGPATFLDDSAAHEPFFGKLDGLPGMDVVSAYMRPTGQPGIPGSGVTGVVVVFGVTGTRKVLVNDSSFHTTYAPSLIDRNGDGILDVKVITNPADPSPVVSYYINDGAGNFTLAP
jgi:hypothetical protein